MRDPGNEAGDQLGRTIYFLLFILNIYAKARHFKEYEKECAAV